MISDVVRTNLKFPSPLSRNAFNFYERHST